MQAKGSGGKTYRLSKKRLYEGGEGQIFRVLREPKRFGIAKLYRPKYQTRHREEKLKTMLKTMPSKDTWRMIVWPQDILYEGGTFIGFIMNRVSGTVPLYKMYAANTGWTWEQRIIMAQNLCGLMQEVHRLGHVIGDLNPNNFGVHPRSGVVTMFDTDSLHIWSEERGTFIRCEVGVSEYLAPELHKKLEVTHGGLDTVSLPTFTEQTDCFGLAVHIFALLMNGCHPFTCAKITFGASVTVPALDVAIRTGQSAFFQELPGLTLPIYAPPLLILPDALQNLFRRAFFSDGRKEKRPLPEDWYHALTELRIDLTRCERHPRRHLYYKNLCGCPWCLLMRQQT